MPEFPMSGDNAALVAVEMRKRIQQNNASIQRVLAAKTGSRKIAHDSGDGKRIFHCPFCGGGDVTAGSDGTVQCHFCNSAFTVQAQPVFHNMPQTIDGQPYQMPGMPYGGDGAPADPNDPSSQVDPSAPPDQGQQPPGGDQAQPGQAPSQPPAGPPADKPSGGNLPPWLKDKKKAAMLLTPEGVALPAESVMRRLALDHADDRETVMADVRGSHRRT